MDLCVSPVWLHRAWYGKLCFEMNPQLSVANGQLTIRVFIKNGIGMRALSCPVQASGTCCIHIPNALRAYCHHLQFAKDMRLNLEGTTLHITVETPSLAIRYQLQNIKLAANVCIDDTDKDMSVEVGTGDWFHICSSMPQKGRMEIKCQNQKRMITIQHSGKKWGAAIMARTKATASVTFLCRADVLHLCFQHVESLPAFSMMTFMDCGVLKWTSGFMQVFVAPQED